MLVFFVGVGLGFFTQVDVLLLQRVVVLECMVNLLLHSSELKLKCGDLRSELLGLPHQIVAVLGVRFKCSLEPVILSLKTSILSLEELLI